MFVLALRCKPVAPATHLSPLPLAQCVSRLAYVSRSTVRILTVCSEMCGLIVREALHTCVAAHAQASGRNRKQWPCCGVLSPSRCHSSYTHVSGSHEPEPLCLCPRREGPWQRIGGPIAPAHRWASHDVCVAGNSLPWWQLHGVVGPVHRSSSLLRPLYVLCS